MRAHGLLLAAGAGSRMGTPKALVSDELGPWLTRGVQTLRDGGCDAVTVVLGAAADEALGLLDGLGVGVVVAHDWAEGMSASLRAGLRALEDADADVAVVHLVDLPDVGPRVVERVVDRAVDRAVDRVGDRAGDRVGDRVGDRAGDRVGDRAGDRVEERAGDRAGDRATAAGATLARASYDGVPGHPVLLGRTHWAPVAASVTGDAGARGYLATHDTLLVECGDLATGTDVDRPR